MQSTLWGPPVWHAMFACAAPASQCSKSRSQALRALCVDQLPYLLPCEECRSNMARHIPIVDRQTRGRDEDDPTYWYRWCYNMKHLVNKKTRRRSITYEELLSRLELHGLQVHEVEVADVLVLMALTAHKLQRHDLFCQMCHTLARLLPVPQDSALSVRLARVDAHRIVNDALECAVGTRAQHGLSTFPLSHYKSVSSK